MLRRSIHCNCASRDVAQRTWLGLFAPHIREPKRHQAAAARPLDDQNLPSHFYLILTTPPFHIFQDIVGPPL